MPNYMYFNRYGKYIFGKIKKKMFGNVKTKI